MSLGSTQDQSEKIAQFSQMATGLGYAPAEVEAFAKLASMGEEARAKREEAKRQKELADYSSKLKLQNDIPYNPSNDATLQRELYLRQNSPAVPKTIKDLASERKALIDAGLDTSVIDEQLKAMKIDPSKKAINEGDKQAIQLVDEILGRDTTPLTGYLRLGGMPLINRTEVNTTKAKVEQLKGLLQLAQAGKLKGSGQISDKEREMLAKAATALDYKMSDEDFRKELIKVKSVLSGTSTGKKSAEDLLDSYWK